MADEGKNAVTLKLKLTPTPGAEHPTIVNCSRIHVAQGMLYMDFGFIEPSKIVSLTRDRYIPEDGTIDGKLIVRVAMPPESVESFQRQLNELLEKTLFQKKKESSK